MTNWRGVSQGWRGSNGSHGLVGEFAGDNISAYKEIVKDSITPSDEIFATAIADATREKINYIGNQSKLVASKRKTDLINDFIRKQAEAQANEQQNDLFGSIGKAFIPIAVKGIASAMAGPAAPVVAPVVAALPIPGLG